MDNSNKTLFIKNLAYTLTEESLKDLIVAEFTAAQEAGTVDHMINIAADEEKNKAVFILKDRNYINREGVNVPRSKGMAFVTLENPEDLDKAIEILNGKEFEGRAIVVEKKREFTGERGGDRGSFRDRRNSGDGAPRWENRSPRREESSSEEEYAA
ncbi:MAG: RNA recognition motif domain-containing protein [Candidatus Dojkabacteria bacterium]